MQIAYIKALYELMQRDADVVSVLSDSGTDYDAMMASEMPGQCYNVGISEQSQIGIAAGLALCGKTPFVYTSGAFLAYRGYEFIRNDICYQNQNVKIVGMGSGTSWRTLGVSHHTTEDISALRALPNLVILSPATPLEAAACVGMAYAHKGPIYIRMGMSGETEFFDEKTEFEIGKATKMCEGADAVIFSTGAILGEVMAAQEKLRERGVLCGVYKMGTLKPIDKAAVLDAASTHNFIYTVEEHNILGGLGAAVAEVLAENGCGCKLKRIGLEDCFAAGYGTQEEVRQVNGLDSESLAGRILADFQR